MKNDAVKGHYAEPRPWAPLLGVSGAAYFADGRMIGVDLDPEPHLGLALRLRTRGITL